MKKNKMLSEIQDKILYPLLGYYVNNVITSIFYHEDILFFKDSYGQIGKIIKDHNSDLKIIINEEIIDIIEHEIFDIILNINEENNIEKYINKLNLLLNNSKLKYKSKILITKIINILRNIIIFSNLIPLKSSIIYPYYIFNNKKIKIIISLN